MKKLLLGALALGLMTLASPAAAQTAATSVQAPAGFAPMQARCVKQAADGTCVPESRTNPGFDDTVIPGTSTDRGAVITTAGSAQQLMAINTARRGFSVQNQSAGACWLNGTGSATADYHSLKLDAGAFYETLPTHVGTGAISIVCAVSSASIYAREW